MSEVIENYVLGFPSFLGGAAYRWKVKLKVFEIKGTAGSCDLM